MFKQLLKDSAIYGFADFFLKIVSFFTFPIFAHLLSVNNYGVMSFAAVIAGFVGMFMSLGLNNSIQRFYFDKDTLKEDRPKLISTGYIIMIVWSTLLTGLFIFVAFLLRPHLLNKYQLPFSFLAMALLTNIPTVLLSYSSDVIRLHFKPVKFLILSFCRNLVGIILALVLMKYYNMGLEGFFIANLIGVAVFVPLGVFLTREDSRLLFDPAIAKKVVRFGYPFIFAGLAYWLFGSMDRWMLGEWSTMEQAGLYSISFRIGSIILFINGAFGQAWSPIAIKMTHDHPDTYKKMFSDLFVYWFALLLILGSVVAFFSTEFLRFTTPTAYWAAANPTVWVVMGLVINGTTQLTAIGISISRQTKYLSYIAWITAIINFIINLLMIPKWGCLGSSIATALTFLVLSGGYLFISQKVHPIPLQGKKMLILMGLLILTTGMCIYLNSLEWSLILIPIKCFWIIGMSVLLFYWKIIDILPLKQMILKKKYA